jgi:ribosomal protein S12 methylthiotransferase rimO
MSEQKKFNVGVISLGCDKNRVDTEKMLAKIKEKHNVTGDIEKADIIIVNTCAFLNSSRKESVEEILSAAEYKKSGSAKKLIVTGCLPQKFLKDTEKGFPEADAFLGVSDYEKINDVIDRITAGERVIEVGAPREEPGKKRLLTTDGYAFLKVADGCDNHCTYCLIPKIRGKYRSVPEEDLLEEAASLGNVKELVLVAQDTAAYGKDLSSEKTLTELIRKLSALPNVFGIRLLYCYPENITEELIHEMSVNAKVIRYIDIPLQHASDAVLKRMNRKGTGAGYLELIEKLRREVPGIAIRSTFITGFPGESEADFDTLVKFLEKAQLEAAGFFKYSREKDTPADKLDGHLPERIKTARLKKLYSVQKKIVSAKNKSLVGRTFNVLAEGFDDNSLVYYGRAYFMAPEVDGKVYFFSGEEVEYGEYYRIKITKSSGYDLYGERV